MDIRSRAEEMARRKAEELQSPPQPLSTSGLESERARAKQALRHEVNAQTGQSVHKIAANTPSAIPEDRILRVAAYCRVSTDDIDQVISIELQKNNYRDMIRANPKWKYVGTYVDDGFSGTNTDHRPAFRLMMKDALAGKIDMIITKSVSRFARNLLDCIGWVRKLKEHEPPIPVFFEQEHLNTMDTTSNIILFVLAMVAEEESHMKSEAMLLSLEWRFSRGRFLTPPLLGYDRVEIPDGHGGHKKVLQVNPEEAKTVQLMYYMLLNGSSTQEIADTLTELGRETGLRKVCGKSNTHWTSKAVSSVLRNERYCGDVLARKTWTPNFHDHKSKKNTGKKNRYYQPGHHKEIVTRAQWNAAQQILNSHKYGHDGTYLPMSVIDHGALKGYISVNRSWAGCDAEDYVRISSIAMEKEEGILETDLGKRHLPDGGHRIPGLTEDSGVQRIARQLSQVEQALKAELDGTTPKQEEAPAYVPAQGFQVVSGNMFSHMNEPMITINKSTVSFNMICIKKMEQMAAQERSSGIGKQRTETDDEKKLLRTKNEHPELKDTYVPSVPLVELLFNPVEHMLALRPSDDSNPNCMAWVDAQGKKRSIGATSFCGILFQIMGWDPDVSYQVSSIVRAKGDEWILFFDLDLSRALKKKQNAGHTQPAQDSEQKKEEERRKETEDTRGIFFGAEDEDEGQEIALDAETEKRLQEYEEMEKRHFGLSLQDFPGSFRLENIDQKGEWDVMAAARVLDQDHQVSPEVVNHLHRSLQKKA